jgi:hypothetical protein
LPSREKEMSCPLINIGEKKRQMLRQIDRKEKWEYIMGKEVGVK